MIKANSIVEIHANGQTFSLRTPSYDQIMAWGKQRKNWSFCARNREFHGEYKWSPRVSDSFKKHFKRQTGVKATYMYAPSFHKLAMQYSTQDELYGFFVDKMISRLHYTWKDGQKRSLMELWVTEAPGAIAAQHGDRFLHDYTSHDYAMAYLWVVANTIDGIHAEVIAKDALERRYADNPSVTIHWADDAMEKKDIDLVIRRDGEIWHLVSVKHNRALSRPAVMKYRVEWRKAEPTLYMDGFLNWISFERGSNEHSGISIHGGPEKHQELMRSTWGV